MSLISTIHLAHLPPTLTIHAALFTNVQNAAFLRAQLVACNPAFEYALIDASTLLSPAHVLAAVFRAANDALAARLRCRNVHAEVVFALSPNNNIAEAFRTFGVGDGTASLLAVKIVDEAAAATGFTHESVAAHLMENVQGTLVPFCEAEVAQLSDLAAIRKAYKLNTSTRKLGKGGTINGQAGLKTDAVNGYGPQNQGNERRELEIAVLGLMALRGS